MTALTDPAANSAYVPGTDVHVAGSASGPLAGTACAVKDIFDIAGHVTGAGNPDWARLASPATKNAPAVQRLLDAGASVNGKTITDELTRGIFGENRHYGTPANPAAPGRIPGGSSSGSASAVASGAADFAIGTDTGGSVRVPASFCGIYGMRPTHGRVPFDGVADHAPSYDTVGWFARDPALLATVGRVLLETTQDVPAPARMLMLTEAFALAEPAVAGAATAAAAALAETLGLPMADFDLPAGGLADWFQAQRTHSNRECWQSFGSWITVNNPVFSYEVAENFAATSAVTDDAAREAATFIAAAREAMRPVFSDGAILCLPTTPCVAPPVRQPMDAIRPLRIRVLTMTCIGGLLGAPQVSLPLCAVDGLPVGLSLIGAPGTDEALLDIAERVGTTVPAR